MTAVDAVPWLTLAGLGAFHGINPGMGWLFAVALGLQERKGSAVWRSLLPLAAGHALAVAGVVIVAAMVGVVLPPGARKWILAAALIALGVSRMRGGRHPRYGGMVTGARDLTVWSLLMASAHGAGLMVLPFMLGGAAPVTDAHTHHAAGIGAGDHQLALGLAAAAVHAACYLAVTGIVAFVVYRWLGLRLLRAAWLNIDLLWGAALVVTGVGTAVIG